MNKRKSNIESQTSRCTDVRGDFSNIELLKLDIRHRTFNVGRSIKSFRGKTFTLLEVVASIAILAMGVVIALQITATGTKRMNNAVSRWKKQHMLSQAAEYYLLAGPYADIPENFFPFEGYHASCEIDVPDISEEIETEFRNWQLVKLIIKITDDDGNEVGKIEMDKILRLEDIE